ncbi:gliding motility lipoprotein GldB [Polaribacter sp. KT 15]|uniref:gliding motility lipoprotein GldB n=1 Tax=Polaribacter sp. KT 15 TaxID=1896175 RepID=UPI00090C1C87|nr:gliding motility lipoprotein GldB [Polaribacter sp. KT 15]SHM97185.1 protein involved in gliding motility GldB [Polaribacter sp. KT 15]
MRFFLVILAVLFSFYSCNTSNSINKIDVSNTTVNFDVKRFDVDFYTSKKENLKELKETYPYFFPKEISDSLSISKMKNKEELELFNETQLIYKDINPLKSQLTSLFKHVKYYNPKFEAPNVVTMLTNIDYDSRVIYADSLLIISLDVYLGKNHRFYNDYPTYIKANNTKNHIIVDVANEIIKRQVLPSRERSFIAKMINEGKKMYLLDFYLPNVSDIEKIGYQEDKFMWIKENEEQIWAYFIEKKLLFSTDTKLNKRFLELAPFSKFYMGQDNLSPGRAGVWLGWQIVRSYMKQNDVSLQELLEINELDLYKKSKYKPRK